MGKYKISVQDIITYFVFTKFAISQDKSVTCKEVKNYVKTARKNLKKAGYKLIVERDEGIIWNLNWYFIGNYALAENNARATEKDFFKNKTLIYRADLNKAVDFIDERHPKGLVKCLKDKQLYNCLFNQNLEK